MRAELNPVRRHRERCRQTRDLMSDYLDGELDPAVEAAARRHVRRCPSCRRMLASLKRTIQGLRELGRSETVAGSSIR
jgi:anti-sigma factor RsiW